MQVKIPKITSETDKRNDTVQTMKQNIETMNQIYKNAYSLYQKKRPYKIYGQPYLTIELYVKKENIHFII